MTEADCVRSNRERASVYIALIAITLGVPLAFVMLPALGVDPFLIIFLVTPMLLLVWGMAGICSLIWSVRSAIRKAWARSLFGLILPVILVFVAVNPLEFLWSCDRIGRTARFVGSKSYYDQKIAAVPADQRPRLVVFIWDGFLGFSSGLLYDETDQITLPSGHRSADWLAKARHTELSCAYSANPLWAHYYLISFSC